MVPLILLLLLLGGCSQMGNNGNSLGFVWVGPGTSATLTINAQTTTTPVVPITPVLPVVPIGVTK